MEAIDDYLGRVLGEDNIPLAYVVRRETQVPATANDPETNYANPNAEMIRRAPHRENNAPSSTYIANNALVANELTKILTDTSAWLPFTNPFWNKSRCTRRPLERFIKTHANPIILWRIDITPKKNITN
jgi:hypothetical protein